MFADAYQGKAVWVSGHTGFKGAWLVQCLLRLGAKVHGFSLPPPTTPSLFDELGLAVHIRHEIGDVRDRDAVCASLRAARPDFVFHLAAQALLREAYRTPIETYAANVLGTAHVLDALRSVEKPCAAVFVTTDKCYENREWIYGYREEDRLGGHDPYSSSKACAEIAIASWRQSFLQGQRACVASARSGNVIGGGDWAQERILPDCIRALQAGTPIQVRSPRAVRPWQHVLEPLSGYLWLGACLAGSASGDAALCSQLSSAFNFGPESDSNRTVQDLTEEVLKHWPGSWQNRDEPGAAHEAGMLRLANDKAKALLGWRPVWPFATAVEHTVTWYRETARDRSQAAELTNRQIDQYQGEAARLGVRWAVDRAARA